MLQTHTRKGEKESNAWESLGEPCIALPEVWPLLWCYCVQPFQTQPWTACQINIGVDPHVGAAGLGHVVCSSLWSCPINFLFVSKSCFKAFGFPPSLSNSALDFPQDYWTCRCLPRLHPEILKVSPWNHLRLLLSDYGLLFVPPLPASLLTWENRKGLSHGACQLSPCFLFPRQPEPFGMNSIYPSLVYLLGFLFF